MGRPRTVGPSQSKSCWVLYLGPISLGAPALTSSTLAPRHIHSPPSRHSPLLHLPQGLFYPCPTYSTLTLSYTCPTYIFPLLHVGHLHHLPRGLLSAPLPPPPRYSLCSNLHVPPPMKNAGTGGLQDLLGGLGWRGHRLAH